MITKLQEITVDIKSNMPIDTPISILGGPYDPAGNTVNTYDLYQWNVTGQSYSGLTVFAIQYRKAGEVAYTTLNMDIPSSFQDAVRILNLQSLGVFWSTPIGSASQIIYISSDAYEFFQLSIA